MIETANEPRTEGPIANAIERQTSRIPPDIFLWTALGFLGFSAVQTISQRGRGSLVAQLAPTLLLLGVYNKLVKVAGSDKDEREGTFGR